MSDIKGRESLYDSYTYDEFTGAMSRRHGNGEYQMKLDPIKGGVRVYYSSGMGRGADYVTHQPSMDEAKKWVNFDIVSGDRYLCLP